MSFRKNISPIGAVGDLLSVWNGGNPHRWRILAVSIALTLGLGIILIPPTQYADPARPIITFITSYAPGRTDAEIIASNIANQAKQDIIEAEQAKRDEFRKDFYRELGRSSGMDMEEIERQAIADEKAYQAKRARQLREFREGSPAAR